MFANEEHEPSKNERINYSNIKSLKNAKSVVILDTETTGFRKAKIVDIAIIDFDGNTLINQLVNPEMSIPKSAMDVHGINNKMVKDSPTWPEVFETVRNILENAVIIAIYNSEFDTDIINYLSEHYNLPKINCNTFCIMTADSALNSSYSNYHGNYKWRSLKVSAKHYGIKHDAHRALGDCIAALGVLKGLCKDSDINVNDIGNGNNHEQVNGNGERKTVRIA